jgi:hypothetical protein
MESLDMLSARKESSEMNEIYVNMYSDNKKELQALSNRITKFMNVDGKLPELQLTDEELDFLSTDKAFSMFYGGGKATYSIDSVNEKIKSRNAVFESNIDEMHTALLEINDLISDTEKDENQIDLDFGNEDNKDIVADDQPAVVEPEETSSSIVTPDVSQSNKVSANPKQVEKFIKQFKQNILSYGVNKSFLKTDDGIRQLSQGIKKSALSTLDCSDEIKTAISAFYSI